jgi:hypothetical protein
MLDVQLDHVADHARPLAERVRRILWGWSPWHLRAQLEETMEQLGEVQYDLATEVFTHSETKEDLAHVLDVYEGERLPVFPVFELDCLRSTTPFDTVTFTLEPSRQREMRWSFRMQDAHQLRSAISSTSLRGHIRKQLLRGLEQMAEKAIAGFMGQTAAAGCYPGRTRPEFRPT